MDPAEAQEEEEDNDKDNDQTTQPANALNADRPFFPAAVMPSAFNRALVPDANEVNVPRLTQLAASALEDILIRGEFDERLKAAGLVFDIANMRTTKGRQNTATTGNTNVQLNNFSLNQDAQASVLATLKRAFGQAGLVDRAETSKAVGSNQATPNPNQQLSPHQGSSDDLQPQVEILDVESEKEEVEPEAVPEEASSNLPSVMFDFSLFEETT